MKTAIKSWVYRITSLLIASSIAVFCFGAGAVIFTRSIEIVTQMNFSGTDSGIILCGIGAALIWIMVLGADSAEHFMKAGFKKADEIKNEEKT